MAWPASTGVGIASINNGRVTVASDFDHERAVKALSTPAGSKPASPYDGLRELIAATGSHVLTPCDRDGQ